MSLIDALSEQLLRIDARHADWIIANSLGLEDMLLVDVAAKLGLRPKVLVLNTGRLHPETLALLNQAKSAYSGLEWEIRTPDPVQLQRFKDQYGIDGFRDSIEARKACCHIRKVQGLHCALQTVSAWVTGQRRDQSQTRSLLETVEQEVSGRYKYNPLAAWRLSDVRDAIDQRRVPYNPLHDQHYPSIGCQPCTRAISAGENLRAGRWWWEQPDTKECGLHPIT